MKALSPTTEFYARVPKDPHENLEFRRDYLAAALSDDDLAHELWIMCSRDLLFYINTFVWILEPRDRPEWQTTTPYGNAREIPFITRPYQDDSMLEMQEFLGKKDILAKKSREMGFSWMALALFDWSWRFETQMHYGLVSRDEATMDKPGDQGSLMVKLDFIDERLPAFLQPGCDSRKFRRRMGGDHVIENKKNGSTITGSACTGEMFSGNRMRAILCDELHKWPAGSDQAAMAATQYVTNCRIFCSTFNGQRGQSGVFFTMTEDTEADMVRIDLHWTLDEEKAAGSYQWDGEKIIQLDKEHPLPAGYPFVKDTPGKIRSPYYDTECRRPGSTPQTIAAELDMDAGGSTNRLFDPATIAFAKKDLREPDFRCKLDKSLGVWHPRLIECDDGPIQMWLPEGMECTFGSKGDQDEGVVYLPPLREFAMGCDISRGTGGSYSSYSAVVVIDKLTGEQVAEFRVIKMKPEPFADFSVTLAKAFNLAVVNPEANGPGIDFIRRIADMRYECNLWHRPKKDGTLDTDEGDKVGYHNSDAGVAALGALELAINEKRLTIHSEQIIRECQRYFVDENGNLKHPLVGKGRVDAPEKSHGDSAIACAMAWWAVHTEPDAEPPEPVEEVPYGSLAWRREYAGQKRHDNPSWWDPYEDRKRSRVAIY